MRSIHGVSSIVTILMVVVGCSGTELLVEGPPVEDPLLHHGTGETDFDTAILEPASNIVVQLSEAQVSFYPINTTVEFWLHRYWASKHKWDRVIGWRTPCGSAGAGTPLYYETTTYYSVPVDSRYSVETSFTPGTFGSYEILAFGTHTQYFANGETDVDNRSDVRCVTLSSTSPPPPPPLSVGIDGPTFVFANETHTWTALVSGGVSPYTFQWYVNGIPAGNAQSLTMDIGGSSFELQVDVRDAGECDGRRHSARDSPRTAHRLRSSVRSRSGRSEQPAFPLRGHTGPQKGASGASTPLVSMHGSPCSSCHLFGSLVSHGLLSHQHHGGVLDTSQ